MQSPCQRRRGRTHTRGYRRGPMMRAFPLLLVSVTTATIAAEPAPAPRRVVRAVIESSLPTAKGNIRQFAFDGDPATYFASDGNAKKNDHLTLTFDQPVKLYAASVLTGRSDQPPSPIGIE